VLTLHGKELEGYEENIMDDVPYWCEETLPGALELLETVRTPTVIDKSFTTPNALADTFASFKGNRMAKATRETAFLDLGAKALVQPLANVPGGTRDLIPVDVSLGIQSDLNVTLKQVETHLQLGNKRIKLKFQPGHDVTLENVTQSTEVIR
jgi:o-succinylbenzoate synthase